MSKTRELSQFGNEVIVHTDGSIGLDNGVSGNLGIGTTSPTRKLDVRGAVRFSVNTSTHETFVFTTQAADDAKQIMKNASSTDTIVLNTGGNSWLNGGNVGIGVTSPNTKLHVYSSSGNTYAKLESNANNTRSALLPYAKKSDGSAITGFIGVVGDANKMEVATTTNDPIHFYTNNNPTNNGIFLKADGNVGIGTDSPGSKLEIFGSNGSNTHSSYGHPVSGGSNGALYIKKANSRFDWDDGLVFCGEGTTWSARFTGRDGLFTNSDTTGEILGVHPVEGSATASWNDTAGASAVTSAFLRVMGNGKTFVKKLIAENTFIAPSHTNDTTASSAGGNVAGAIYYNTGSGVHRSYNGSFWSNIGVAPITESTFDAFGDGSALCLLKANNSNLDTGGNHNASLHNGVTYNTTSKFGSHSFNTMGNGTYFDIASLPMVETVSFWYHCVGSDRGYLVDFRHDAPGNGRSYLYTHSGGGSQNINMGNDTTTTNRTGVIYIDGVQFTSGQYNFNSGVWYHICIVRNATDTHRTWDQGLRFGNRSDGTTEGNAGYFDQIRVFNRQISAAEALSLYNEIA